MPITRLGMHPVVGWYGFVDDHYKNCRFGLLPSEDGVKGGPAKSVNCEALLPRLALAKRWEAPAWPKFILYGDHERVAEFREMEGYAQLGIVDGKKPRVYFDLRRLDAPNRTLPGRLAVGWWTFSILDSPQWNDPRLLLTIDGRISDVARCPPDHVLAHLAKFVGGRWKADEGGLTLHAPEKWRSLRFEGSGRKLISGSSMMVHDA
jgi:hypothetical protein